MAGAPMQDQPDSDRDWFEDFLERWANPKRIYRGWWIVLVGFFLLAVVTRLQGGFYDNLKWDYPSKGIDWFPGEFDRYVLAGVALVLAPVIGYVVDRRGALVVVIPMMIGSTILFAAAVLREETWLIHLSWLVTMGVIGGVLLIVFVKVVTARFKRHRAKALAVLVAGVILAPALPFPNIHRIGYWLFYDFTRGGWPAPGPLNLTDAAVYLAIGSIPAFFVLRGAARHRATTSGEGLLVVIDTDEVTEQETPPPPIHRQGLPLRSVLLDRSYLLLLAACACQAGTLSVLPFMFGIAYTTYHVPYAPMHLSVSMWPLMNSPQMGIVLPGAVALFLTGVLADHSGSRKALLISIALQPVCFLAAAIPIDGWSDVCFGIATGIGVGSLSAATLALLSEYWGWKNLGVTLGIIASAMLAGHLLAYTPLVSSIHNADALISYLLLPLVVLLLLALALALILLMKRPQSAVPNPPMAEAETQVATS